MYKGLLLCFGGLCSSDCASRPCPLHLDDSRHCWLFRRTPGRCPCGGFVPDYDTHVLNDFFVSGTAVGTKTTHATDNWLYRITLDETASGNWTQINAIVQQTGAGDFCLSRVVAPDEFVDKRGVLSIVSGTSHGYLYQCAAVRFVKGTAPVNPACINGTAVTGGFVNDPELQSLVQHEPTETVNDGHDDHGGHAETPTTTAATGIASSLIPMGWFVLIGLVSMLSGFTVL
ncbi:uncharacterized protein B0I36DRAFT_337299 [Microdochium trichocladiopsis]|uniref:Copper acquisition factor BIM1-like domain-containing protein n=1 Tax=Microdochium trichocladiopsis TaxID=1682393 RepID=A0A9P8XWD6_9PEZI|nr:uncharacterized protein B0I36DRAFT_337299 [Microdochium trichocladiopsis]KAH7016311.1 hypothetical protein B0I36DRAFT_337299 [Microdochium trichocladiopsis]